MTRRSLLGAWAFVCCAYGALAGALECPPLVRSARGVDVGAFTQGLLWRIDGGGAGESYVFDTIHISDPRVTDLPEAVTTALARSDTFAMEVSLDADALQRMSRAMYFNGGQRLYELLAPALYTRTAELLSRYGVGAEAIARLRPWAAYTTLSLPPGSNAMPLDMVLMSRARADGKRTFGLETIDEQVAVFDALSADEQIELLTLAVCHYGRFQREIDEMIGHYLDRDLAAMLRMSTRYESALQDRFMDVLLDQRNLRMVERMQPFLRNQRVFIAIGALHLPGTNGVLQLLRDAGYGVTLMY